MTSSSSSSSSSSSRLLGVGLFAVVAAIALALALHAATGDLFAFDRAISDELQLVPGGRFYEPVANALALGVVEYTLLGVASAVAWRSDRRALAVAVLFVLLARTLNTPFKELIERPRPDAPEMLIRDPAPGFGFPSGHSSTVVLVYGYAAIVAAACLRARIAAPIVVAAAGVVLLIGWDRVYDGAHWPSDVLGGWAFGLSLLLLAIAIPAAVHAVRPSGTGAADERDVGQAGSRGLGWQYGDRTDPGAG